MTYVAVKCDLIEIQLNLWKLLGRCLQLVHSYCHSWIWMGCHGKSFLHQFQIIQQLVEGFKVGIVNSSPFPSHDLKVINIYSRQASNQVRSTACLKLHPIHWHTVFVRIEAPASIPVIFDQLQFKLGFYVKIGIGIDICSGLQLYGDIVRLLL